jgi:hypothetical protein
MCSSSESHLALMSEAWAANIATNREEGGSHDAAYHSRKAKIGFFMLSQSVALPPDSTPLKQLQALENGVSTDQALALFDALPPIPVTEMFGSWRGRGLQTGHPLDGLLETFGWHGKRFEGPEDVHPLVFDRLDGDRDLPGVRSTQAHSGL